MNAYKREFNKGNMLLSVMALSFITGFTFLSLIQLSNTYISTQSKLKAKTAALSRHSFLLVQLSEWIKYQEIKTPLIYPNPFPVKEQLKKNPVLKYFSVQEKAAIHYVPTKATLNTEDGVLDIDMEMDKSGMFSLANPDQLKSNPQFAYAAIIDPVKINLPQLASMFKSPDKTLVSEQTAEHMSVAKISFLKYVLTEADVPRAILVKVESDANGKTESTTAEVAIDLPPVVPIATPTPTPVPMCDVVEKTEPKTFGLDPYLGNLPNPYAVSGAVNQEIVKRGLKYGAVTQPLVGSYLVGNVWQEDKGMLQFVCNILQYETVVTWGCWDNERSTRYPVGKCFFHSPSDNLTTMYNTQTNRFQTIGHSGYDKYTHAWISTITCKDKKVKKPCP